MKCARCGKKFITTSAGWGYAYGGKYACSYRCMRALEKEDKGLTEEEKTKVEEMSAQGVGIDQICEEMKLSWHAVAAYLGMKRKKEGVKALTEAIGEATQAAKEPEGDDLKQAVIRLMNDMIEILKRIV